MSRRSTAEQTSREERLTAIDRCRRCDPCGWRLGPDDTPIDPAIRCTHTNPPAIRDVTAPIYEADLFTEPRQTPSDTDGAQR